MLDLSDVHSVTENLRAYLVDYGLAYRFRTRAGVHKPFAHDERRAHEGTLEFTSRDAHEGSELSTPCYYPRTVVTPNISAQHLDQHRWQISVDALFRNKQIYKSIFFISPPHNVHLLAKTSLWKNFPYFLNPHTISFVNKGMLWGSDIGHSIFNVNLLCMSKVKRQNADPINFQRKKIHKISYVESNCHAFILGTRKNQLAL